MQAHGEPIPKELIDVWADIEEAGVNSLQTFMCGFPRFVVNVKFLYVPIV